MQDCVFRATAFEMAYLDMRWQAFRTDCIRSDDIIAALKESVDKGFESPFETSDTDEENESSGPRDQ